MLRYALIATALLLTSGCDSLSTLHTATPVEKGEVAVTVAPTVVGATGENDDPTIGLDVELMGRSGIVDDVDFGIKSGIQRPSLCVRYRYGARQQRALRLFCGPVLQHWQPPHRQLRYQPRVRGRVDR